MGIGKRSFPMAGLGNRRGGRKEIRGVNLVGKEGKGAMFQCGLPAGIVKGDSVTLRKMGEANGLKKVVQRGGESIREKRESSEPYLVRRSPRTWE